MERVYARSIRQTLDNVKQYLQQYIWSNNTVRSGLLVVFSQLLKLSGKVPGERTNIHVILLKLVNTKKL